MSVAGTARAVGPGELKALVRALVKAAGGVEACAVELGISAQRVSQLQDVNNPGQMGVLQISQLEMVVRRPIVTGVVARAAEGLGGEDAIGLSAVQSVGSSAALLQKVHAMEADGHRTEAEKRDVIRAAEENLREAQEALDAAVRL